MLPINKRMTLKTRVQKYMRILLRVTNMFGEDVKERQVSGKVRKMTGYVHWYRFSQHIFSASPQLCSTPLPWVIACLHSPPGSLAMISLTPMDTQIHINVHMDACLCGCVRHRWAYNTHLTEAPWISWSIVHYQPIAILSMPPAANGS